MYVKTISATYIRKLDLGNYANAELQVSLWADTGDADVDAANKLLWKIARASVSQQAVRLSKEEKIEPMPPIQTGPDVEYDPRRLFIKTVGIKYSRKLKQSPDSYGMFTAEFTTFASLDPADDLIKCLEALWEMARANIVAQLKPVVTKMEVDLETAFLGLPEDVRNAYFETVASENPTESE